MSADLYRLMAFELVAKAREEVNPTFRNHFESAARAYLRMAEQARHRQPAVTPEPAKTDRSGAGH